MKKLVLGLVVSGVLASGLSAKVDMCLHYAQQLNSYIKSTQKAYKEGLADEERRGYRMIVHYTNQTIISCPENSNSYKFAKHVQQANRELGISK